MTDEQIRDFQRAAEIAHGNGALSTKSIEELMVFSTMYFINDLQSVMAVVARKRAEEKGQSRPANYMTNAIKQVEEISDELDSWDDNYNGRP